MPGSVADRVRLGVAWLDAHHPGWWNHIDVRVLDISQPCQCIVGQLHLALADDADPDPGIWYDRLDWLIRADSDTSRPVTSGWEMNHGFNTNADDWELLTELWALTVLERQVTAHVG